MEGENPEIAPIALVSPELAALGIEAAGIEGAAAVDAGVPAPAGDQSLEGELRSALDFLVQFADAVLSEPVNAPQSLAEIFTPERKASLATNGAAFLQKYHLTVPEAVSKWGPELGLAMSLFAVVPPTIALVKSRGAEGRNPAPAASNVPAPRPRPVPGDAIPANQ